MTELNNQVVLITGAAGGFGREMTRQFTGAGSHLILTDYDEKTFELTDNVVATYQADLSCREGCEDLYNQVKQDGVIPDILINNAGITRYGQFDEIPSDVWESVIQVNLLAPMRLCHLFIPDMIARGSGHIVNISSLAGWAAVKGEASYSTAKYGLRGFGESLYAELKPHNIQVTTVYPFFSDTPLLNFQHYGSLVAPKLPRNMLTKPEEVIAEVLAGIRKNQQHIFPDKHGKVIHRLKRFVPGLLVMLNRRMEKRSS